MRVFYASGQWHQPGEHVQPGSWGRVVQGAGSAHGWFGHEMLIELIRQTEFPDAPSRLRSLMASDNADTARLWLQPPRSHIYELEVSTAPLSVDVGWINRLVPNAAVHDLDGAKECIRNYWSGELCPDSAPRELLVEQPGLVIARL